MRSYTEKTMDSILAKTFGGIWKWNQYSKKWVGEKFSVYKSGNRVRRSDTEETLAFDSALGIFRNANYNFVRNTLIEKFGGNWEIDKRLSRWFSKEHDFSVYRGTVAIDGKIYQAYRRSDTEKLIEFKHNDKILNLLNRKRHSKENA